MDKRSGGIISFEEVAECINLIEVDISTDEFRYKVITNLSNYFKTLSNTDFDEEQFKKVCLE